MQVSRYYRNTMLHANRNPRLPPRRIPFDEILAATKQTHEREVAFAEALHVHKMSTYDQARWQRSLRGAHR